VFSFRYVATLVSFFSMAVGVSAQGTGPASFTKPTTGDAPCAQNTNPNDTLVAPDEVSGTYQGFHSVFDGASFKGWWQDCQTGHSSNDKANGAIFRIATAEKAIYSTQRNGNAGGILLTHKIQKHYEIIFDIWPSFGDDGGLFNRVTLDGQCFQTVLDYIQDGAYGGTWGEGGYLGRDLRPFQFNNNKASDLKIPGAGNADWTAFTKGLNPTSFGCSASGCTQADWDNLWDLNGWNTTRIKFWGGLTSADPTVHMQSWFLTKTTPRHWVPLWVDSLTLTTAQMNQWPANPTGFQVHGSGRFGGANGNWYKNIYMRYLDEVTGAPATGPVTPSTDHNPGEEPVSILRGHGLNQNIFQAPDGLRGTASLAHEVRVCDSQGRLLEKFSGKAGAFHYTFGSASRGILFVEMRTAEGAQVFRINHI